MVHHTLAFVVAAAALVAPATAAAAPAPRTFGLITFTAPDGFTVDTSSPDHLVLSRVGAKSYCLIAIYNPGDAEADLDASFAAEWQDVMLHTIDPIAAPATTPAQIGGADARFGGVMGVAGGKPAFALLTAVDAGAKVVSIVVLTPNADDFKIYLPSVQAFLQSITVRRVEASAPAAATTATDVPAPARPLVLADLVGAWKHDDGVMSTYVSGSTGDYAGFSSIQTRTAWTVSAKGTVLVDFYGVTAGNGGARQIAEKHLETFTIRPDGTLILHPKPGEGVEERYLVRGWLVGPELTILKINGPWYNDDVGRRARRSRQGRQPRSVLGAQLQARQAEVTGGAAPRYGVARAPIAIG